MLLRCWVFACLLALGVADLDKAAAEFFGLASNWFGAAGLRCVSTPCGVVTRLERTLEGTGFHRSLVTRVAASWPPGVEAAADCTIALLESLPAGAYADAYELAAAERKGTVPPARVFGEVNIERPAPECGASTVAVLAPASPGSTAGSRQLQAEVHVAMPVHARYPAPTQPPDTTAQLVLPPPRVLLRCAGGAWRVATLTDEVAASAFVMWHVPSGNVSHARPVEVATAVAAVAGALLVLTRLWALGKCKP